MKISLKQRLNTLIEDRKGGMVSINEIRQICDEYHYKQSNAERRLRASESPNVEPIFKHGAIIGYKWKPAGRPTCCTDMIAFGQHFGVCKDSVPSGQLAF